LIRLKTLSEPHAHAVVGFFQSQIKSSPGDFADSLLQDIDENKYQDLADFELH